MRVRFAATAPLEICYWTVSFVVEVKIFSFGLKTMDYSQGV